MNVILFIVVLHDLTDYGFMEPILSPDMQILMVIGRNNWPNIDKPKHHLTAFNTKDVEIESSKVYVFNGILNKADPQKGKHDVTNSFSIQILKVVCINIICTCT